MILSTRETDRLLARIRRFVADERVQFTTKAHEELLRLRLRRTDCLDVLAKLTPSDFASRLRSNQSDEWMYVFTPAILWTRLYVKLVLRASCVVISFHDKKGPDDQDAK